MLEGLNDLLKELKVSSQAHRAMSEEHEKMVEANRQEIGLAEDLTKRDIGIIFSTILGTIEYLGLNEHTRGKDLATGLLLYHIGFIKAHKDCIVDAWLASGETMANLKQNSRTALDCDCLEEAVALVIDARTTARKREEEARAAASRPDTKVN